MEKVYADKLLPIVIKILVWGALAWILYLLRSFFLLVFLTFVFAYIQNNGVVKLKRWIDSRAVRVCLVGLSLLLFLVLVGLYLVPQIKDQAAFFASRYSTYIRNVDLEIASLVKKYPSLYPLLGKTLDPEVVDGLIQGEWSSDKSLTNRFFEGLAGLGGAHGGKVEIKETLNTLGNIGGALLAAVSAFFLSLLFSFLIVFDLPKLTASVRKLKDSKLAFVYNEVAYSIYNFGRVLGRALEAQLFIAILNTILTAVGIYMLDLGDKVAFLSMIVFICSFIPVAGVIVSSVPICLLALQGGSVTTMLLAVGLITLIHLIETYVLNPKIYGHHLRMNPVIVLIILTVGGKLFHIWGLILGVPICNYIFRHAIWTHSQNHPDDRVY